MGQRVERCQSARIAKTSKKNVPTQAKCIPQQGPVFQREGRRNTGRILEKIGGY